MFLITISLFYDKCCKPELQPHVGRDLVTCIINIVSFQLDNVMKNGAKYLFNVVGCDFTSSECGIQFR